MMVNNITEFNMTMVLSYINLSYFLNPLQKRQLSNLVTQLLIFRVVDMFPQTIKIRVSWHCHIRQIGLEKN